jgi:nucleotidyltransferase substrate binding protein (TIGR01987 family)
MNDKSTSLLTDLSQALARLTEVLQETPNSIIEDATIQRFEFTFELSWKLMQSILQDNRIETFGVKSVVRSSAQLGLISDPALWLHYLESRNLTAHVYNAKQAHEIYLKLIDFPLLVSELIGNAPKH